LKISLSEIDDVKIIGFPSSSIGGIGKILNEFSAIFFILYFSLKTKQSIIYSTAPGHKLLILLNWLQGKKTVFRSSSLDQDDVISLINKRGTFFKRVNKFIYGRISIYWAISSEFEKRYCQVYIKFKHKTLKIFQGYDPKLFYPVTQNQKLSIRNKLAIKPNDFIILSLGYVLKRKGILDNIHALNQLKSEIKFKYIIVGDFMANDSDPYHKKWSLSRINEMKEIYQTGKNLLDDSIEFIGRIEEPSKYLRASDLLLHTSYAEGMPNSVIEAMACGLPVIMRQIAGVTDDLIENEKNGFLIENNEEIIKYIKYLYSDIGIRERMGSEAFHFIKVKGDIKQVAKKIISKWEE
jgi:glycosyltransferase involved in cell wall biosynthesis